MVLIEDLSINLLELTIPTNIYEALQAARNRKSRKPLYLQLVSDLEDHGLSVSFLTLESQNNPIQTVKNLDCLLLSYF